MAQRLAPRWSRMARRRRWLKRRRSGHCRCGLRSRRCTAREEFRSKEEMLGIVWRDGNAKEMEVTLTQTEMAKVAVTTTGGEVEDDGEAEDLSFGFFSSRVMCGVGQLGLEEMEA
uniref:Uncharacterized protein n=1 Tax=Oryza sativa subsp. japonica TaxID=39947 RepID=Q5W656_ORYSJ|nr:hypothetical protein [Oryza sativa Japonica Group]AAV44101.1 hypothetical protein [Oryza sativa Japonica Group]